MNSTLDYAKSVHTRWTYTRVSSLSTYWTMLICRATCPELTYDNMKAQIERVYSSKQPTATNGSQISAEPRFVTDHDDYYYEDEHADEVGTDETEDAY